MAGNRKLGGIASAASASAEAQRGDFSAAELGKPGNAALQALRPSRWLHDDMSCTLDPLWNLLAQRGKAAWARGSPSLLQHSLDCATLALDAGAAAETIVACLFHDIGHLLCAEFNRPGSLGRQDRHHVLGAGYLSLWFGPSITEPVRLHVAAKRYLVAANSGYFKQLSPHARQSLVLQGGPLVAERIAEFLQQPYADAALQLRRLDDRASSGRIKSAAPTFLREIAESCLPAVAVDSPS